MCELSRQASKTESCDDTRPADSVISDLLQKCHIDPPPSTQDTAQSQELPEDRKTVSKTSERSDSSETLSPPNEDMENGRMTKDAAAAVPHRQVDGVTAPAVLLTQPSFDSACGENLVSSWPSASFSWQRDKQKLERRDSGAHMTGDSFTAVARRNSWRLRQKKHRSESLSGEAKRPTELWSATPSVPISVESPVDFPSLTPSEEVNPRTRWSGQWSSGQQTLAQRLSSPDSDVGRRRSLTKTLSSPTVISRTDRDLRLQNSGHPILQRLSPVSGAAFSSSDLTKPRRPVSRRLTLTHKHESPSLSTTPVSDSIALRLEDFPPLSQSSPRGGSLRSSVSSSDPPCELNHSPREVTASNPCLPTSQRDKLSTERWVESSVTFTQELEPVPSIESTRL